MNVVLLEPEIHLNVGNIGRTCVATNTCLHLIEPLGFKISDKAIRRSGLDYWEHLKVQVYCDLEDFYEKNPKAKSRMFFATTKARRGYCHVNYLPGDYIMFGKESAGIPEEILVEHEKNCIRIPMWGKVRSLNLSNSVAVILYEALRQNGFGEMAQQGALHRLTWEQGEEKDGKTGR